MRSTRIWTEKPIHRTELGDVRSKVVSARTELKAGRSGEFEPEEVSSGERENA